MRRGLSESGRKNPNVGTYNLKEVGCGGSWTMTGGRAPCGACKFLRRKCVEGCVFAPYFCSETSAAHFAAVHKVFGASNVSKMLLQIPTPDQRCEAAMSISYEAQARIEDPVYGCVSHIFALEQQVANLQVQLRFLKSLLARSLAMNPQAVLHDSQYNPVIQTGPCTPQYEYSVSDPNGINSIISASIFTSSPYELHFPANFSMSCNQNEVGNYAVCNGLVAKDESAALSPKFIHNDDELATSTPFQVSAIGQQLMDENNFI